MIIVTDWRMDYQQYVCIYIYIYVHVFQIFDFVLFVHIIIFIMIDTSVLRVYMCCTVGSIFLSLY